MAPSNLCSWIRPCAWPLKASPLPVFGSLTVLSVASSSSESELSLSDASLSPSCFGPELFNDVGGILTDYKIVTHFTIVSSSSSSYNTIFLWQFACRVQRYRYQNLIETGNAQ